ncbi:RTX toxin [Vibrio sp. 10N.261.51.F12]|uniref:RTX toxin n=1 Tax=Vibrio sp. 10N.261.51.F12 TaxID=3229679 RepID=UPI00354E8AA6
MVPVLYVQAGDLTWKVFADGTWAKVAPNEVLLSGVQVVTQSIEELGEVKELSPEQTKALELELQETLNDLSNDIADAQGQVDSSSTSNNNGSGGFAIALQATLDETIARAGFDTRPSTIGDSNERARSEGESFDTLSQSATLSIVIQDEVYSSGYLNQFEIPAVTISGTTSDVRDGRIVNVTITDDAGNTVLVSAEVINNAYVVNNVDLNGLNEGSLVVTGVISDDFGNSISAEDSSIKDTKAFTILRFDGFGDGYINATESSEERIYGVAVNVERGQNIELLITDTSGNSVQITANVGLLGFYVIREEDISSLQDGELTIVATTIDLAGNPATASDTIIKDTQASITVEFDGFGDTYINAVESDTAHFYGQVLNVEVGQTVTLIVKDEHGVTMTFETVVMSDGTYDITGNDVSSLQDGILSVEAIVLDQAGNVAIAEDSIIKDTQATISVQFDGFGDEELSLNEVGSERLFGQVMNVESGQEVALTVSDRTGQSLTFRTTVNENGEYELLDVDLSSLSDGELTVAASVTDIAGNTATSQDTILKDTQAAILVRFDGGGDNYLNSEEVTTESIFGLVKNIEVGQPVSLSITDSLGVSITLTTSVTANGTFSVADEDLSSLAEGTLHVTATSSDLAGNVATNSDTIIKDTLAHIDVDFDGIGDRFINGIEVPSTRLYGQTQNIDFGQSVTLVVSDQEGLQQSYVVNTQPDGSFELIVDLAGLADGPLTVEADVADVAGNTASASNEIIKDTQATIDVAFDGEGDSFINLAEISSVRLFGQTTDIETNQVVTLIVSDVNGDSVTLYASVTADGSYELDGQDLATLADGTLNIVASVSDIAGNETSNQNSIVKDTLAQIDVLFDGEGDEELSTDEISQTRIYGQTSNIESGQVVTLVVSDEAGQTITLQTTVENDGSYTVNNADLSSLSDGELAVVATVNDVAGNNATADDDIVKDTQAAIFVHLNGFGDDYLNAQEAPAENIWGIVKNIEPNQPITLVVSDVLNNTVTINTVVGQLGTFSVSDIDLSGLSEGMLTVKATSSDLAGNIATNTDTIIKDTQAAVSVAFDGNGDDYLNLAEVANTTLFGGTQFVEAGQAVSLVITDSVGNRVEQTTNTLADGSYRIEGIDFSSLEDGSLTVVASVTDIAGNVSQSQDIIVKDTKAQITVEFDGFGDEELSKFEVETSRIFGQVENVEAGQIVKLSITDTDSSTVIVNVAVAADGSFEATGVDLSMLKDGDLVVEAVVTDIAGNTTTNDDTILKDTKAFIVVQFVGFGDGYLNASEVEQETIIGLTKNIEAGQLVTLQIEDSEGSTITLTTSVTESGAFAISDLDLSNLAEGALSINANTVDLAGNPATWSDSIVKDTLADINVSIDGQGDEYLNATESLAATISGLTQNVEAGQTVTIVVTDIAGRSLSTSAIVESDGGYTVSDLDLTNLVDGVLKVEANVSDIAGNESNSSDQIVKDTKASIVVSFDGFGDEELSKVEVDAARLFGQTSNIEAGQAINLVVSDIDGNELVFTTTIASDGSYELNDLDFSGFNEGLLTVDATTTDIAGNPASSTDSIVKDTRAFILVRFDGGGDNYLNAEEVPADTIFGLTKNIEAGQTVSIQVIDKNGLSLSFTSVVESNGSFTVNDQDFSSLAEGELTVIANVSDVAGNTAMASDTIIKDTLASITVEFDGEGDALLNAMESQSATIFGQVTNVEPGQHVDVVVTDTAGTQIEAVATVQADGHFTIEDNDLSALVDGDLSVEASVVDIAGNQTTNSNTIVKDTQAKISVNFEGYGDNYLNASEVDSELIYGATSNVEVGQSILVTVTDSVGNSVDFTSTVGASGSYALFNVDLSSLQDGMLSVVAATKDIAGNPAQATDYIVKDTMASITVEFDGEGDTFINAQESTAARIFGQTQDVESGQSIKLTVTDSAGVTLILSAIVQADGSYEITGEDISSLQDGDLTVQAQVLDTAGNIALADNIIVKDTLAQIAVDFDGQGDRYINDSESNSVRLFGQVSNVESGQVVNLVITDINGTSIEVETTVQGDGTFELLDQDITSLADGALVVNATVSDIAGNQVSASNDIVKDTTATIGVSFDGFGDEELSIDEVSGERLYGEVENVETGQNVTLTVSDTSGSTLLFNTSVLADGSYEVLNADLSSLEDGVLTVVAETVDIAGNPTTSKDVILKDTSAEIFVTFDGFGDEYLNSAEVTQELIHGRVKNIEPGQSVDLTVEDSNGLSLDFTTAVNLNGSFNLVDVDLSFLAEGQLTVTATATDRAGNSATASDTIVKDTLASVTVEFDGNGDEFLNSAEIGAVRLFGQATNIEAGQTISLTVTDLSGNPIDYTAVVDVIGRYEIASVDLSSLDEGELTIQAVIEDIAGNTATATDSIIKDTLAAISVDFDGNGDDELNKDEVLTSRVFGETSNVEDGQVVILTITDSIGTQIQLSTTVSDGKFEVANNDLSALEDGELNVIAEVTDVAGNETTATDTIVKDTKAFILVRFDGFGDGYLNLDESQDETLYGFTKNIEVGQQVALLITDAAGNSVTLLSAVEADGSYRIENQDLTTLVDGELSVTATATDVGGNTAVANDTIIKDTQIGITIDIDDGGDGILNENELNPVKVFGSVSNVEDGQTILVTLTSQTRNFFVIKETIVSGGTWQIDNIDASEFWDGTLVAFAEVTDVAGNRAEALDTGTEVDTEKPRIDIDTLDGFSILDFRNSDLTQMQGITEGVEQGLPVTLTISDGTQDIIYQVGVDASGRWVVSNIDITALDSSVEWTISAAVSDAAGNSAVDDMPTIILPESVSFSETVIGIFGEETQDSDVQIQFADFTFYEQQTLAEQLTSEGQSLSLEITDSLIIARRSDGESVFEAKLIDNLVQIQFFKAVDQGVNLDSIQSALIIKGTQYDSDGSTEVVLGHLAVTIKDSEPVIFDEQYEVTEGEVTSGNVLNNDIDLDGELIIDTVTIEGVSQDISGASPAVFDLPEGQLTVFANGHWNFSASRDLDHNSPQSISFTYLAGDSGFDFGEGIATIDILDGAAGVIGTGSVTDVEASIGDRPQVIEGNVIVSAGSDNPDTDSIVFTEQTIVDLTAQGITFGDPASELNYELSEDGKTLLATAERVGEIFRIELNISTEPSSNNLMASFSLTLSQALNHTLDSDLLNFPLYLSGVDSDGTPLELGRFDFNLNDGADPDLQAGTSISISEDGLADGPVIADGHFTLDLGSDFLAFNQTLDAQLYFDLSHQPSLTSNGEIVKYTIDPSGSIVTGYTGELGDEGSLVFIIALDQPEVYEEGQIGYGFSLFKAVDQNSDPFSIPFVVTVKDQDGDRDQLTLNIGIDDGTSGTITSEVLTTTELPRSITTPSLINGEDESTLTIESTFDAITYLGLDVSNGDTVLDSSGNAVTKSGESISWRDNGDGTFDGITADNVVIFRISLPEDFGLAPSESTTVTLKAEVFDQVDHGTPGTPSDTVLQLPLPVMTIDSDGTKQVVESTLEILDGRAPRIQVVGDLNVDEDGLLDDNQSAAEQDSKPTIVLTEGSDDFSHYVIDTEAFDALKYTSGGSDITLNDKNADGWYFAYNDNGKKVFKLRIDEDPQSDKFGEVKFVLFKPLDHEDSDGAEKNNLELSFIVAAVDADDDQSVGHEVIVNVTDAIPESVSKEIEITEGDDFSGQFLDDNVAGADGGEIASFVYEGTRYQFDESTTSHTIDLTNDFDGTNYGSITVNNDGSYTLKTNDSVQTDPNDPVLRDSIIFTVRDADGDEVDSEGLLILDDAEGFIRAFNSETREDESTLIEFYVVLGDLDQNEQVSQVDIDAASLNGGTVLLGGVALSVVDGKVTIPSDQLVTIDGRFVTPAGALTFLPALNQSNTTSTTSIAISAIITTASGDDKTVSQELDVSVLPVADLPDWDESTFEYASMEDSSEPLMLNIEASLFDQDGSESLTYTFANIPDGVSLLLNGNPIDEGAQYTQAQLAIMEIQMAENVAGVFEFDITAVATEAGNDFFSPSDETASITHTIVVDVKPDADTPVLSVKDIRGFEDQAIDLKEALIGTLTDTDGSETLYYEIVVQDGWTLSGTGFTNPEPNVYWLESDALDSSLALLVPKEDISSVTQSLSIQVTAVSRESTQDGLDPVNEFARSDTQTVNITLQGVVDEPIVEDGGNGHWSFDSDNNVIQTVTEFPEDELVPLDFMFVSPDDDQSEVLNVLLTDLPDGVRLVDSNGNPITLTIASIDPNTGPVYQLSNEELSQLYLKTEEDFSGRVEFKALVTTTEPDGDSARFSYTVQVDLTPVVDQSEGQVVSTEGIEDRQIALNLSPSVDQDQDGSEVLTGYIIDPLPEELTLYFDGSVIDVSLRGLDLETLLDSTTPTLEQLLNSGRLSVVATEDLSGTFDIPVRYEVTDTSELGATQVKEITGEISVIVDAKVEIDTRLISNAAVYESDDGSPVDVSGAVHFVDEDIDGSEYLDYFTIILPEGYDFIVEHPNGASQTSDGSWIIDAGELTSDSIKDFASLLDGTTIRSYDNMTEPGDVVVRARVVDGEDARFIDTSFKIFITGIDGGGGECPDIGEPGDIEANDDIIFDEGTEVLDLSGLLNPDVASDEDNSVSFYIPADSLPEGVELQGDGVLVEYDNAGEVIGYSISQEGLSHLQVVGLDEDFSGCLQFTVETTETSGCSGESKTTLQTINIDIHPVVDEFVLSSSLTTINEDNSTDLNLEILLGDSVEAGQTITGEGNPATGQETINSLEITVSDGAILSAPGITLWLVDHGDGSYTITDATKLSEVVLTPPENFSGDITLTATASITDSVTCLPGEDDTQTKTSTLTVSIAPVVDAAQLVSADVLGDEDSYIPLDSLSAQLIDQDGSESMSLSLEGVPEGAVLVFFDGSAYQVMPNNGPDGGSFNGNPTYEWQLDVEQLSQTFILPPLDYSGDIPLTLTAITQELETGDVRFTRSEFTLGVKPVGDDVTVFDMPEVLEGTEDSAIVIELNAESTETNSDEFLELTVVVNSSSDASALDGLDKIKVGFETARFVSLPNGNAAATLLISASSLAGFELYAGDAFGEFDISISLRTFDSNTVLGNYSADLGAVNEQQLTLIIAPEPDEPILTSLYHSISAEATGSIDLGLDMAMVNPAMDEVGTLTLRGVPDGLVLSHGTRDGDDYLVDVDEVSELSIIGGYSGEQDFELILEPSASLDGETAVGLSQTLQVNLSDIGNNTLGGTVLADYLDGGTGNDTLIASSGRDVLVGGAGDDSLTGGLGSDTFIFNVDDVGSSTTPAVDTIMDFDVSADTDMIDLSSLLSGASTGAEVDTFVDLEQQGDDVVINIKPDTTNVTQKIVLVSTSLDEIYGSDSTGVSEANILQKMIDDQNLIINT